MKPISVFLFLLSALSAFGQWFSYGPAVKSAERHDWPALDRQLDSLQAAWPDSAVVPMTLYAVANKLYDQKAYPQLKSHSYRLIAYEARRESTRFPVTDDKKWDWVRREEARKLAAKGHHYLSTLYFSEQQYDSCLAHVDLGTHGHNYAGMRYFGAILLQAMHRRYMKSVCLEHRNGPGDMEQARGVLTPFVLLDGIYNDDNFLFGHDKLVEQYIHLLERTGTRTEVKAQLKQALDSLTIETLIPLQNLAIRLDRYEYYGIGENYLLPLEGSYVPIVMDRHYWIDHPYSDGKRKTTRQNNNRNPEPAKPDPDRVLYMKKYLAQTLLFRSL
jgi:hypothetical protein